MKSFEAARVLVAADFREGCEAALAVRELGGQVIAVGFAGPAEKRLLAHAGVDTAGIVRSRKAVVEAIVWRRGSWDAMLFAAPEWTVESEEVAAVEMEDAATDGRGPRSILRVGDERMEGLTSVRQWAALVLARAARMPWTEAMEFARTQTGGHEIQNSDSGRSRTKAPAKRKRTGGRKRVL